MQMPEMDGIALARAIKADPQIAAVRLVMLTSVVLHTDLPDLKRLGIESHLNKPVRQSQLYDCLAMVINRKSASSSSFLHTRPSPKALSTGFNAAVLLVEDNPVNQDVAVEMLEALGCQVDTAAHGLEALATLQQTAYDLILMDCQMPEMDGFAATRAIRERESQSAAGETAHRTPIIALTANAFEQDREQCLAAGMDDYLSKPYAMEQMCAVLEPWLPVNRSPGLSLPTARQARHQLSKAPMRPSPISIKPPWTPSGRCNGRVSPMCSAGLSSAT